MMEKKKKTFWPQSTEPTMNHAFKTKLVRTMFIVNNVYYDKNIFRIFLFISAYFISLF